MIEVEPARILPRMVGFGPHLVSIDQARGKRVTPKEHCLQASELGTCHLQEIVVERIPIVCSGWSTRLDLARSSAR